MKKIAILTINDYANYGNRLQNYATQEVLKSLGFSVQTVVNNTKYENNTCYKKRKLRDRISDLKIMPFKKAYTTIKCKVWHKVYNKKIEQHKIKRIETFKNFTKYNIVETDYNISEDNIPRDLSDIFDYFITGSDQVWNPTFRYGSPIDFLTFAPQNKRIAYAPSFGISKIPFEYEERYKTWLSGIHEVSVREESGAKIIKDFTGRDAIVLVDPTLMITKEKWLSVSKEDFNKPKCKYLLTYFLGEISEENRYKIKSIAKENKLKIVNLGNIKDLKTYKAGPSEFIDYINSASVLFTDSFHGCVFSILLDTPFVVFDRESDLPSMNSRIDTLLKTFKLEERKSKNVVTNNQIFQAEYIYVKPILTEERKKAVKYLKDALNI